jgi:hypothetical protein
MLRFIRQWLRYRRTVHRTAALSALSVHILNQGGKHDQTQT